MQLKFFKKPSYKYDVFLCHAYKDQETLTNTLYEELRKSGIRVWYSARHMPVGDDLDEVIINTVIPECRYGLVVITRDYFTAEWAKKELIALRRHEALRKSNMILPVWHQVDEEQVKCELPFLANRFAARTGGDMDDVIKKLRNKIIDHSGYGFFHRFKIFLLLNKLSVAAVFILLAACWFLYGFLVRNAVIDKKQLAAGVEDQINMMNAVSEQAFHRWVLQTGAKQVSLDEMMTTHSLFMPDAGKGTHSFQFITGERKLQGKKHLQEFNITVNGFYNKYGVDSCEQYFHSDSSSFECSFYNTANVSYEIGEVKVTASNKAVVTVEFKQQIRLVQTVIKKNTEGKYRSRMIVYGFRPSEHFEFKKVKNKWIYINNL